MTRAESITLAMAAATAARFRPNAFAQTRPEEEAYLALRRFLTDNYPAVNNDILDVGPASAERQSVLRTQLQEAGADRDTAVLRQAQQLLQLLIKRNPSAAVAVFATVADLQEASTIITKYLEEIEYEQRNRPRHPHHFPGTAAPAYL